tara:strand:+ start:26982 stop:27152 length:171 start_codon:yes stop_codon:yes gene_type:complete
MNIHRELDVKKHFDENKSLTVDLVDHEGNATQQTFFSKEEAITDIRNLEGEFEVYF